MIDVEEGVTFMVKTGMYVGLDIGTSSIKVIVAEFVENQMNIIGVGNARSEGVSRGIIVDIDKTVNAIKAAVTQAEEKAGIKIRRVNVGIPANLLQSEDCQGMIAVSNQTKEINDEDVLNVAAAALVRSIPPEREIIAMLPESFTVDGFEGIKDPRGMLGVRLEMYGTIFTGPKTVIHNTRKCVENAGLQVDEIIITPLALTHSILSEGERDFGTTVIDMGGGQTTTAVMHDNQLKYTDVNQEGGDFVTKDISIVLNTSMKNAEALKINYGDAFPERTSTEEEIPVDVIGQAEPVKIDERYLSEIIEARIEQIFQKAKDKLDAIEALKLPGGVVLSGGAARLPGVVELAQDIFEVPVKLYVPNHMGLRDPAFANVLAIAEYAVSLDEVYELTKSAITGERPKTFRQPISPKVNAPASIQEEEVEEEPIYEMHEEQEPSHSDEFDFTTDETDEEHEHAPSHPAQKRSGTKGVGGKIKDFFSNIFE